MVVNKYLNAFVVCMSIFGGSLLSGCGIAHNIAASQPLAPSISFRVVSPTKERQLSFGKAPAQNAVFKSQQDVDAFLAKLTEEASASQGRNSEISLPPIDFAKEQGVLVLFGLAGSADVGEISAIEEKADRFVVHSILWTSKKSDYTFAALSFPCQYVAMPRSDKPVEFAETVRRTRMNAWWEIF